MKPGWRHLVDFGTPQTHLRPCHSVRHGRQFAQSYDDSGHTLLDMTEIRWLLWHAFGKLILGSGMMSISAKASGGTPEERLTVRIMMAYFVRSCKNSGDFTID